MKNKIENAAIFKDKRILITGGTGSLGRRLVSRILIGELGIPAKIIIFSRDEAKQHQMQVEWRQKIVATEDIIYRNSEDILEFRIGDIRDVYSITNALRDVDIVINAAALKQVPTCEYFPFEAVLTNIVGVHNIVSTIANNGFKVDTVVGVSTDKACKPVNAMGMTKSIQERIFIGGNLICPSTRFICVRYGNVLASRGSVIPLFLDQIRRGGPVTVTTPDMTRFLLSLDKAVDTIFAALEVAKPGETFIPKIPSARIIDIVDVLIGGSNIETKVIGIRPGEKTHEVLVSEEECFRTLERNGFYVIQAILPELRQAKLPQKLLKGEYTSANNLISKDQIRDMLKKNNLISEDNSSVVGRGNDVISLEAEYV